MPQYSNMKLNHIKLFEEMSHKKILVINFRSPKIPELEYKLQSLRFDIDMFDWKDVSEKDFNEISGGYLPTTRIKTFGTIQLLLDVL